MITRLLLTNECSTNYVHVIVTKKYAVKVIPRNSVYIFVFIFFYFLLSFQMSGNSIDEYEKSFRVLDPL